jgi:hypothetical protein
MEFLPMRPAKAESTREAAPIRSAINGAAVAIAFWAARLMDVHVTRHVHDFDVGP